MKEIYFYDPSCKIVIYLNDTRRRKLCFTQLSTRMAVWVLLIFVISLNKPFKFQTLYHHVLKSKDNGKIDIQNE